MTSKKKAESGEKMSSHNMQSLINQKINILIKDLIESILEKGDKTISTRSYRLAKPKNIFQRLFPSVS